VTGWWLLGFDSTGTGDATARAPSEPSAPLTPETISRDLRGRGRAHGRKRLSLLAALRSSRSVSAMPARARGSLRNSALRTGLSTPARTAGSGSSVASAVSVANVVERAYGERPSTAA
jgi:hypothetical protein